MTVADAPYNPDYEPANVILRNGRYETILGRRVKDGEVEYKIAATAGVRWKDAALIDRKSKPCPSHESD